MKIRASISSYKESNLQSWTKYLEQNRKIR